MENRKEKAGIGEKTVGIKTKQIDNKMSNSPAVLLAVAEFFTGAGTAVLFLLTSDVDLFFSEATLSTRRKMCLGLE